MYYHRLAIVGCLGFLLTNCSRLCGQTGRTATATAASATSEPVLKSDDDPKTIIAKVLEVYGRQKARRGCGHVKYREALDARPAGPGDSRRVVSEGTVEEWFQLPGHYKRVAHQEVSGKDMAWVTVIAPGRAWYKRGDDEAIQMPWTAPNWEPFVSYCEALDLERLNASDALFCSLGVSKLNGKDAIGIAATPGQTSFASVFPFSVFQGAAPGQREAAEVDFYFDPQSGVLFNFVESSAGRVRTRQRADYKVFQGMPVPMRITYALGEWDKTTLNVWHTRTYFVNEVKFEPKLEDSVFAKP
jgi:hypothetical protein